MHPWAAVGAGRGQEAQPDSVLVQQPRSGFGQIGPDCANSAHVTIAHTLAKRGPH